MSAFLGPIHYWLYNKIRLQQTIVDELYLLGGQYNLNLKKECEDRYGECVNKPLEDMIDQGNIHGWLQERVSQVEYKYAYVVTALIDNAPEVKDKLKSILCSKGNEQAQTIRTTSDTPKASALYTLMTDQLLDGMPCDHANRLVSQNDTEVNWTRNLCVHTPYWDEVGGNINLYYELREAWMKGFLKEFNYLLEKIDATSYRIYTL